MPKTISQLKIEKLHGNRNYNLSLSDNTLILVGENGSGKTTVLKILFYILSGQIVSLSKYKFESITITIDGKDFLIKGDDVRNPLQDLEYSELRKMPTPIRHFLMEKVQSEEELDWGELERRFIRHGYPRIYLHELYESKSGKKAENIKKLIAKVGEDLGSQVLYLPTYRRIEEELNQIIKTKDTLEEIKKNIRKDTPRDSTYIELVEFGMSDVQRLIETELLALKQFSSTNLNNLTLSYLGDVVDEKYDSLNINRIKKESRGSIESILSRVDVNIISRKQRESILGIIDSIKQGEEASFRGKLICHYLIKLLEFQRRLRQKEDSITNFCTVCNQYMSNKIFNYDSPSSTFSIKDKRYGNEVVELRHLSSGEKQIASLFSHIYLSEGKKYFVLIDEPELSLSVPWQRKFLEDIRSGEYCSGLVAVTHSPFIYDNSLRPYAHGLGEFLV